MFALLARSGEAQQVPTASDDPAATAPIRLGVVGIEPRLALTSLGIDTNVFNSRGNKQRDVTFTLTPGTMLWMRTGKGLLTIDAQAGFVYFKEFESERSINSSAGGTYELRFNRMRPYFSASTLNTRERPGYEIDARARHYETEFHVGTDLRTGSKGVIRLDTERLYYTFAGDEVFDGRPLNEQLNRTLTVVDLSWRQRLTALTTWVTRVSRESERFEFDDRRNSDSFRLRSGFELGRLALIRGSAFAGYRSLTQAEGGNLPEFSGFTADVNVAYTAPTQTRLSTTVLRDIEYSYEQLTPYYVQTGWTASLTQRVTGRWDVEVTGGRTRLSYQSHDPLAERTDKVAQFGGGIGYAVGEGLRISGDVISLYRRSATPEREFGSLRYGISVMYDY